MCFWYKKSSLLGLPLVNMSSSFDSKNGRHFQLLILTFEPELRRLGSALAVLTLVDILFLLVFLWRISVLAFGIVLAIVVVLFLLSTVMSAAWAGLCLEGATRRLDRCYFFSSPALIYCLVLLSPPVLEMVEAGLLIFKAAKSDDFCSNSMSSTIVLAVLDFAIAAPVFFAGFGNALSYLKIILDCFRMMRDG